MFKAGDILVFKQLYTVSYNNSLPYNGNNFLAYPGDTVIVIKHYYDFEEMKNGNRWESIIGLFFGKKEVNDGAAIKISYLNFDIADFEII